MPYPKIRLQNHGKRNHHLWWIVVQSSNKCFKGRIIEKLGMWVPNRRNTVDRAIMYNKHRLNYWLSVGAQPTEGVHRLLSMLNILPKKPIPFGSKSLYSKPEKTYKLEFFHKHRWTLEPDKVDSVNEFYLQKIQEMKQIYERKNLVDKEALNEMTGMNRFLINNKKEKVGSDVDTDGIDSDDHDFHSRKRNFDIISKRFTQHLETKYKLYRGNDLKYNNYVRKMEKLASGMSLDLSGFKDFLININKMKDSQTEMAKKLASNFFKEYEERELRREETKKFAENNQPTSFINSSLNEVKIVIDAIERGFNNEFKKFFKVNENDLENKEFQDVRNLRLAKFIKKLRMSIISHSIMQHLGNNQNTKSAYEELFNKIDKEIEFSDIPYEKADLFNAVLTNKSAEYHDQVFACFNKHLASSETIKKYHNTFLDEEIIENLNKDEFKGTLAKNEVYLLYNDRALELALAHAYEVLKKSYNMNEIFRDQEKMEEMEIRDKERHKRKENLKAKIEKLKNKLFNELLFDERVEDSSTKAIPEPNVEIISTPDEINNNNNNNTPETVQINPTRVNDYRRRIPKVIKFTEKQNLIKEIGSLEVELNGQNNEYLDEKFKVQHKVILVHPDKKPTNKKITELDIAEEKRKFEYLENEKILQEKYSNYDPSDKLHQYFSKTLSENKDLIVDEREKREIDNYLTNAPPVRQYYDNLALFYEEFEHATKKSKEVFEEVEHYENEEFDIDDEEFEEELYEDKQEITEHDGDEYLVEVEKKLESLHYFAPAFYESEKYDLDNKLNEISKSHFNSDQFKNSLKRAIIHFENNKPRLQYLEETVEGIKYNDYIFNQDHVKYNNELKAELERQEHINRIKDQQTYRKKIKLVEDKPFPKQLNRREKRKRTYLINGVKIMQIPPPRRNKDDPVREKDNRKPRNEEKENARLMSNVVRQNLKNNQITEDRVKIIKERYIQYFGQFRALMYPDGFRHLENYNMFKFVFPNKSMNDYQNELYTICDFDTFFQVILGHFEQFKKLGLLAFEFEEMIHLMPYYLNYLKSKHSVFIPIVKESYRNILREYQANDRNFTVLDAVELVCQFNNSILSMPKIKELFNNSDVLTQNLDQTYIPTKYTTIPFPDMKGDKGDESGLNRTSPFFPINPLKGHPIKQDATFMQRKVTNYKMNFNVTGKRFHTDGRKVNNEETEIRVEEKQGSIFKSLKFLNMRERYLNWRIKNNDLKI